MVLGGAVAGLILLLTWLNGGKLDIGTGPRGASFDLGFQGPGFAR